MAREKGKRYPSDDWKVRKAKHKRRGRPPAAAAAAAPLVVPPPPRKRGRPPKARPAQAAPPAAAAAPAAPPARRAPQHDLSAFLRTRSAAPTGKPLPSLGELAAQEAPELAAVSGGVCPSCNREHGDTDRHCVHCGVQLRRACPSCDKPLKDAQQFCPECGAQAPTGHVKPSDGPRAIVARELPEDAPPTPAQRWDGDDMFWVAAGVDVALIQLGGDICDNDQRQRINSRAADVANKHLRIGGKWKEEIKLGMAIAGVLFPALYTHFVIAPRAKRAELAARAQAAQAAQAPQPNGDQAQTTTSLRSV